LELIARKDIYNYIINTAFYDIESKIVTIKTTDW